MKPGHPPRLDGNYIIIILMIIIINNIINNNNIMGLFKGSKNTLHVGRGIKQFTQEQNIIRAMFAGMATLTKTIGLGEFF